jgi:hypothetical protein
MSPNRRNTWINHYADEDAKRKKRKFIPSAAFIREQAAASHEGGRATCHFCHQSFSMTYIKFCYVAPFKEEPVCKDCRCERHLQMV